MTSTNRKKAFDCVEFKRRAQAEIFEEIRDMTHREQIEYFNRHARTGRVGAWWSKIARASAPGQAGTSDPGERSV